MLNTLCEFSHKYGSNPEFVLAGGGNTSCKDDKYLYIKGSGSSLATIKAEQFVKMDRAKLAAMWTKKYPADEAEREAAVLNDLMAARAPGEESKRPSVETMLHDLFKQKFVLHVHPAMVNGVTCSKGGAAFVSELFPEAVWVESTRPGYVLALLCRDRLADYEREKGKAAKVIFLANHGIFFAADSAEELDEIVGGVMEKLEAVIIRRPDFTPVALESDSEIDAAVKTAVALRMLCGNGKPAVAHFVRNREVLNFAESEDAFLPLVGSFTPDHIVYCKAHPLYLNSTDTDEIKSALDEYKNKYSCTPKVIFVKKLGMFAVGATRREAATVEAVWLDAIKIAVYSESFGGYEPMTDDLIDFIVNWEVESYRSKVSLAGASAKRLDGKIAVVTGSAQGFGKGIAEDLAAEGAYIIVADMNKAGAEACAAELCAKLGAGTAIAVNANVSDEESVKSMINTAVLEYGGLDVFVNNAGIVRAGGLDEMTKSTFELVTAVNYTAYFLCAKYASAVMKLQHAIAPDYLMDIIEINSKSGLEGSKKNFAYAGSKFGGIGLTESFALELCEYNIKVNAICPGNFLNGPLWSDPEKGLFVQYLNAGKVPGAKTVEDVRRFYESKVPMGRGCEVKDVTRAIMYVIEQEYETGQAIPVTGGQNMLK
jgi:rhamnose utilization protein RhaD (predicted bifunctional aldolase and dehydrogenase)/NAD(P)-dependent dehydrogenase (short-subunit alcohol dehydrogenase family)